MSDSTVTPDPLIEIKERDGNDVDKRWMVMEIERVRDAHYLVVGENGTLRSEIERLTDDLVALRAKMAETAKIVDSYWTFNDNQQHTHTWHDKQDALAAIRKETK